MKEFPNSISVSNKNNFADISYERLKCYLRRDIYEHVISKKEEEYFSLDQFNERVNNIELVKKMIKEIIPELETFGWNCNLSYGDTGLFIYSDKKPANCWQEDSLC